MNEVPKKLPKIHLLDIEKSRYKDYRVNTDLTVVGLGEVYIVPDTFTIECRRKDFENKTAPPPRGDCSNCTISKFDNTVMIPVDDDFFIDAVRRNREKVFGIAMGAALRHTRKEFACSQVGVSGITGYRTVSELVAYPYAQEIRSDKGKIIDEAGREFRKKSIYYLGDKDRTVQSYRATGVPLPNPKNQAATLLVEKLEPINVIPEGIIPVMFSLEELEDKTACLSKITGIHGRLDAHLAVLLTFSSPLAFHFEGRRHPGWLKTAFVGDTTTGKGETAIGIRREIGLGGLAVGESASRAGILYGIETVGSTHVLTWGLIPRYDGQLLIIDGCNQLRPDEWTSCREAIRQGIVNVQRIVGGTHPTRTRLIFIGNSRRSLALYNTRIEAILDLFQPPDIARLDLVLTFANDDVAAEEINRQQVEGGDIDQIIEMFRSNIGFAWQCPPENISFSPEAERLNLLLSSGLMQKFLADDIPLLSNDTKVKLARLSVATALLSGHTWVDTEHVQFAHDFLVRLHTYNQLDRYATFRRGLLAEKEGQVQEAADWMAEQMEIDDDLQRIVYEVLAQGKKVNQKAIAEILIRDRNTIGIRIRNLKSHGLVVSTKDGIIPTILFHEAYQLL